MPCTLSRDKVSKKGPVTLSINLFSNYVYNFNKYNSNNIHLKTNKKDYVFCVTVIMKINYFEGLKLNVRMKI